MKPLFFVALAVIVLCGCAGPVRIAGENVRSKPLHYPEFSEYLEAREHAPVSQIRFQRDSLGAKLFISFFFRTGNEPTYRTLIVTRDGIKEIPGYPRVWHDDQGNPVFRLEGVRHRYEGEGRSERFFSRLEDANYVFKNGPAIPFKEIPGIMGVSGGDFIMLRFQERAAWIVASAENPRQALLELPRDFAPNAAYATGDKLIVFATHRPPTGEYRDSCLMYQKSADGYLLSGKIPIPWGGNFYDFDVKTGYALITGTATKFKGYYRFNIRTKHRVPLGFAPSEGVLFLKDDVIRTLDEALHKAH